MCLHVWKKIFSLQQTSSTTFSEAQNTRDMLRTEVTDLSLEKHGLRFKATSATVEQLESAFMHQLTEKMQEVAPNLWHLFFALLDSTLQQRQAMGGNVKVGNEDMDIYVEERDLGEFGGDNIGGMMHEEDDVNEEADNEQSGKHQRRAAERNAALLVIRTVTSNSRCNLLQGWLGFFMRSACVPEKVVKVFAHVGLSISLMSFVSAMSATVIPLYGINDDNFDALRSLAQLWDRDSHNPSLSVLPVMTEWRSFLQLHKDDAYSRQTHPNRLSPRQEVFSWHVHAILVNQVEGFKHFKKELDEPDTVKRIPLHKTNQIPCRAMDIKQSTTDGNVEVLDNLFRQGGIGDPHDSGFDAEHDVDMSEHIMLIHGDL
ncbi:hypothetical protein DEU56DRAFT_874321 [Suillus clintonianus]|uniref:uncharacterized protein n=1 Tax=Suillus clintonianus TaxID=1904413 RepID=UPI001B85FF83|nr:uncharacterized protein DEU56DRAFT_874321 [Suillus clintonianus]KAG2114388.1 hypothetical protein DEU56DRAFT_874321 [Suillus clintonianus]